MAKPKPKPQPVSPATTMEDACHEHPSRDFSRRFARDAQLRRFGFKIHTRPRKGEPLWELCGLLYT